MIYLTEKIGNKTVYISERQLRSILSEAADEMFSLTALHSINTFSGRYKFCLEHLGKPIGRGSSRAVFQISDTDVLKLAINTKGLAQNVVESEWYKQSYDFIPKIYDIGPHCAWINCEFVLPAKKKDFIVCLGMKFEEFCNYLRIVASQYAKHGWGKYSQEEYDKVYELAEEKPIFGEIVQYMTDAQIPVGDMTRIANWGLAQRNGEPTVVLLDHGLTEAIWEEFYKK